MALDLSKAKIQERKLLQKKAKLDSDLARLQRKTNEARRRADSHRKIVLGVVTIAAIRDGGIPEPLIRRMIEMHASDRDRKVFENFDFATGEVVVPPEPAASESDASMPEETASAE